MDKTGEYKVGSPCAYCSQPAVDCAGGVPVCRTHLDAPDRSFKQAVELAAQDRARDNTGETR